MTKWPIQKLAQGTTQKLLQHHDATDIVFIVNVQKSYLKYKLFFLVILFYYKWIFFYADDQNGHCGFNWQMCTCELKWQMWMCVY